MTTERQDELWGELLTLIADPTKTLRLLRRVKEREPEMGEWRTASCVLRHALGHGTAEVVRLAVTDINDDAF